MKANRHKETEKREGSVRTETRREEAETVGRELSVSDRGERVDGCVWRREDGGHSYYFHPGLMHGGRDHKLLVRKNLASSSAVFIWQSCPVGCAIRDDGTQFPSHPSKLYLCNIITTGTLCSMVILILQALTGNSKANELASGAFLNTITVFMTLTFFSQTSWKNDVAA